MNVGNLDEWLEDVTPYNGKPPVVTLSYAQSLDGCLSVERGKTTAISGRDSLIRTHLIRSRHQAIMVGVGTIFSDDPQLNVRYVDGPHPQPVILDTHLRIPMQCRLMQRGDLRPWIFTGEKEGSAKWNELAKSGVRLFSIPVGLDGLLDLKAMLNHLTELEIKTLMVEGGARVITSFIKQRLAQRAVITLSPVWIGGLSAVEERVYRPETDGSFCMPALRNARIGNCGRDFMLYGWCDEEIR